MGKINEQHLMDEIRFDIGVKDLIKGKLVLAALGHVSRETQKEALSEVISADDGFAIPLLAGFVAGNPDLAKIFPHVRETMFSKVLDNPDILLDAIPTSNDPAAKILMTEIAGEIRFDKAVPLLLDLLKKEKDVRLIKAVISSLGMIGDPSAVAPISEHLYSNNRDIVMAAVRALGDIAVPEALQKLLDRLGGETDIDHMIMDIIARIQTPEAVEKLNEILSSKFVHLRTAAKKKLSEIGTMSVRVLVKNLLKDNTDLIIHSLNVLGDLGDSAAIAPVRKLLFNEPKDPNIRFAAYEALGRLPLDKNAFTLAAGLEDPVDNVRDAVARAIDHNYNPVLAGGVRNLIRSGNALALKIIMTVINAQCENIFLDLIEEDYFKIPAVRYLSTKAHPDVRAEFSRLLARAGYKELSNEITSKEEAYGKGRLKVFAVDDSRMILNIYRAVLHNLGCEAQLFEFPASAIERLNIERPDIIFTDLNMPDISGIDLTKAVRRLFSGEELPVVMVTTQDEERDNNAAYDAGVDLIMKKPFSEAHIKDVLGELKKKQG
ncbi:MAG: HEAT repeat domain-containing protein [Deltaproteobacteria bacterium]|nr:HEAT repeat domain-containing protein [Deltaproteobacteria bacterium]